MQHQRIVKAWYKSSCGYGVNLGSSDIYEELEDIHSDLYYSEYGQESLRTSYGINPHCSRVLAGCDESVKKWLF